MAKRPTKTDPELVPGEPWHPRGPWMNPDPDELTQLGPANVPKELTETFRFGGDEMTATLRFEVIDGAVILTAITTTGGLPVTEALDRLGRIEERGKDAVLRWLRGTLTGWTEPARSYEAAFVASVAATPMTRRKNRLTPDHFREVAKVYQEADEAGDYPTKAVAAKFKVSRSTAAHWVVQARKDGYLPEAKESWQ